MGNFLSGALASARSRLSPIFFRTRSYAALRAADLDWIVGPGYSLGRVHQKRYRRGVTTDLGGGQGRNKQKRYKFHH